MPQGVGIFFCTLHFLSKKLKTGKCNNFSFGFLLVNNKKEHIRVEKQRNQ